MKEESKLDKVLEAEFSSDMLDLKSKLKTIVAEKEVKQKTKIIKFLLPALGIAASIVLAIVFLPNLLETSNSDLYSNYYEPYPMVLNQRGDNEASLNEAIAAYSSENYETASSAFLSLFDESKNPIYLLYHGSSEQALNKNLKAIEIYNQVIALDDERVVQQAQWYKILALYNLDRKDEARQLISSLPQDHYKFNEAQAFK